VTLGRMPTAPVAPPGAHDYSRAAVATPPAPARYTPVPTTPAADFDLALLVPDGVAAADVERVIRRAAGDTLEQLVLFDEYRGSNIAAGTRSLAWRLTFRHPERTLRDKEIDGRRRQVVKVLEEEMGIRVRAS